MSERNVKEQENGEDDPDIICKCLQVTEARIRAAIAAGNLTTVEQVTATCGAGGGCHSCHILLQLFIDQHQESRDGPKLKAPSEKKHGFWARLLGR